MTEKFQFFRIYCRNVCFCYCFVQKQHFLWISKLFCSDITVCAMSDQDCFSVILRIYWFFTIKAKRVMLTDFVHLLRHDLIILYKNCDVPLKLHFLNLILTLRLNVWLIFLMIERGNFTRPTHLRSKWSVMWPTM